MAVVWLEANENYQKQSYRNRCNFYAADGKQSLSVPVVHEGGTYSIPITRIKVDYSKPWTQQHKRAIVSAYRPSAFFDYYEDEFFALLDRHSETLWELNLSLLRFFLDKLELPVELRFTEEFTLSRPGHADSAAALPSSALVGSNGDGPAIRDDLLAPAALVGSDGCGPAIRDDLRLAPAALVGSDGDGGGAVGGVFPSAHPAGDLHATAELWKGLPYNETVGAYDLREVIHPKRPDDILTRTHMEKPYFQVFACKHGFIPNLSIMDLLFNEGPNSLSYILP